jgi:hypothetical protein
VKIPGHWQRGDTQLSLVTCSRALTTRPVPELTPLTGSGAAPSVSLRGCSCCPSHGAALPIRALNGAPTAPPPHGDQALAAGSEPETRTGLGRQLVDGARLLENGPSPCQRESPTVTLAAAPSPRRAREREYGARALPAAARGGAAGQDALCVCAGGYS